MGKKEKNELKDIEYYVGLECEVVLNDATHIYGVIALDGDNINIKYSNFGFKTINVNKNDIESIKRLKS